MQKSNWNKLRGKIGSEKSIKTPISIMNEGRRAPLWNQIYMDGLIRFLGQTKSSEIPIVKQLFSFNSPHHYWLAPMSCRTRLDMPGNPLATEIHESPASHRFSDRFTQAGNRTPALELQIHQQPAELFHPHCQTTSVILIYANNVISFFRNR